MTTYTDKNGITTKIEIDEIGWSCLDASTIYKATITEFSIERGIISVQTKIVNSDGTDYRPKYYRNHWNSLTPVKEYIAK